VQEINVFNENMISSTLDFIKYSTSDKTLSTEERKKCEVIYDIRKAEILQNLSAIEIEKEFTSLFETYPFPSAQHKQNVKRSLQRIIPKVFRGFGCDIQYNTVTIRELLENESIDIRGKITIVSCEDKNASIFASSTNNVKTFQCDNCYKLEKKIAELEKIIKWLSLDKNTNK
jgi:hypothetical protein